MLAVDPLDTLSFRTSQVAHKFADAIPLGVKRGESIILNPQPPFIIQEGDELIVLAEDDDTYTCNLENECVFLSQPGKEPATAG